MDQFAKLLILLGGGLVVLGLVLWGLARLGFRGLPGDIAWKSEHLHFYFPLVTCLVLSALLTAGFWMWKWFHKG